MLRKTASPTATVWAYSLNYFTGALFLLDALGWDIFGNQHRGDGYSALAQSIVFFSVGIVFHSLHRKAK